MMVAARSVAASTTPRAGDLLFVTTADEEDTMGGAMQVAACLDVLLARRQVRTEQTEPGKRIWVKVHREQDQVVCTVRDGGPGFGTEDQARLFRKGVRLANSPTGGEISTGYGLAIAKDLVEKIGGVIGCESRPGQGATFFIRLPAFADAS